MQQLRERDQELAVLTSELEGLRAHNQALQRQVAASVVGQQQLAAVQEAERQVQQLQGMVSRSSYCMLWSLLLCSQVLWLCVCIVLSGLL